MRTVAGFALLAAACVLLSGCTVTAVFDEAFAARFEVFSQTFSLTGGANTNGFTPISFQQNSICYASVFGCP